MKHLSLCIFCVGVVLSTHTAQCSQSPYGSPMSPSDELKAPPTPTLDTMSIYTNENNSPRQNDSPMTSPSPDSSTSPTGSLKKPNYKTPPSPTLEEKEKNGKKNNLLYLLEQQKKGDLTVSKLPYLPVPGFIDTKKFNP